MFGLNKNSIRDMKRLKRIANVLFKHGLGYVVERLNLKSHLPFSKRLQREKFSSPITSLPERLRIIFEDLGGSFVKLGQMLSLRYDLLPKEFCEEFSKLQDNVKPLSYTTIRKVVEQELGGSINTFFKEFHKNPIASASVGQVHKAKLHSGEIVAVKVQRPNISETFESDISLLYELVNIIQRHFPETKEYNLRLMVEEFELYTKKEMDYMIEARNIEIFHENFIDNENVIVPKVYWKHTTNKLLTMSYVHGTKISEVQNFKKYHSSVKPVVRNVLNSMVQQIFDYKVFHADPHPGNILLIGYNKIALLDFGIVGRLLPELVEAMEDILIGLLNQDLDTVVNAYLKLGITSSPDFDSKKFKEDLIERFAEYYGAKLEQINFATFFSNIFDVARKYKIMLPLNFTLLAKSMITLQGFCAKYAPDFNLINFIQPKVEQMVKDRYKPRHIVSSFKRITTNFKDFTRTFPSDLLSFMRSIKEGTFVKLKINTKDLRNFTLELDRSSNRLTLGLMIAALIIANSIFVHANVKPLISGFPLLSYISIFFIIILSLILIISVLREGRSINKGGEP